MQDEQIIDLYWKRSEEAIRETEIKYGKYCGTITEGDLLRQVLVHEDRGEWEHILLRDVMGRETRRPVNIMAYMDELLQLAMTQNFVSVVDDRGMFIGIVTRQDIMRYFAKAYRALEQRAEQ